MALLEMHDLKTFFTTKRGVVKAVNGVSYKVEAGRTLGVVGESGSGKSVSAMSMLQLLDGNGYIAGGSIMFDGKDLTKMPLSEMQKIRGNAISVIFQEPMTSLNPVFTIERQVSEPFIIHQGLSKEEARKKVVEMLADVKIPSPEVVAKQYPHQLSGGMRQRVMIAMALACKPKLLIADEPTTALDVTIQAQISKLMNDLKREHGTSILFITHDLGVIAQMADDVAVMYCGQVVEMAPAKTLFTDCEFSHPYTEGLMVSIPRLDTPAGVRLESIPGSVPHPAQSAEGLQIRAPLQILPAALPRGRAGAGERDGGAAGALLLPQKGGAPCKPQITRGKKVLLRQQPQAILPAEEKGLYVKANDGITLDIYEGETFGLVGESGCGKSTLGRTLLQLYRQTDAPDDVLRPHAG